jgi:hypothetical protein
MPGTSSLWKPVCAKAYPARPGARNAGAAYAGIDVADGSRRVMD